MEHAKMEISRAERGRKREKKRGEVELGVDMSLTVTHRFHMMAVHRLILVFFLLQHI